MEARPIELFAQTLFEHGVEGYDAAAKDTPSKGVTNPGGAKIFAHYNLTAPTCAISIRDEGLMKLFTAKGVVLYAVNRIRLDEEKKPVRVATGGYDRINHGLMAYCTSGLEAAQRFKKQVLSTISTNSNLDASGYVEVLSEIPNLNTQDLAQIRFRNSLGQDAPIDQKGLVLMAFPSGGPASNALWSYNNRKTTSRQAMAKASTADAHEVNDLPF